MVKKNSETAVVVVAIIVIFNPRNKTNPDPLAGPIFGQFSKRGIWNSAGVKIRSFCVD